jgi:hypothetical protein
MPKSWGQMSVDEKLDTMHRDFDGLIDHVNRNAVRTNDSIATINERLKKIDDALAPK